MLEKVNVGVRCRPAGMASRDLNSSEIFNFVIGEEDENMQTITTQKNKFKFSHVFNPSTQREVFNVFALPLLEKALHGYNATILAYGQTGSGKTFTMGTEMMSANPGITEMVLEKIFQTPDIDVKVSVLEIYKEECYDLLHKTPTKLNVQGMKAVNMAEKDISNFETAKTMLQGAMKNRRVGQTVSNQRSSRSHVVITFKLTTANLSSKINLVDLAGSEKVSDFRNERHDEGVAINTGLLALKRVVDSLSQSSAHVPFRDSRLTFILQDSLSNKNYIALIACINSMKSNLEETEKTLDWASKFAKIEVTPIVGKIIGTPYKTPQRYQTPQKFPNKTFCSSSEKLFKKPLAPLNWTVATPVSWAMKRKEGNVAVQQALTTTSWPLRRDSVDDLNMSNVSTSTALTSSPPDRLDGPVSAAVSMARAPAPPVNFDVHACFKATVEAAQASAKVTEKRLMQFEKRMTVRLEKCMTQLFKNMGQQENAQSWQSRLSEAGLDSPVSSEDSDGESSLLQTTVVGNNVCEDEEATPEFDSATAPSSTKDVFKMPLVLPPRGKSGKDNLNGSFISDDSWTPGSTVGEFDSGMDTQASSGSFKKPPPRRSTRLSVLKRPLVDSYDSDDTPEPKIARRKNSFAVPEVPKSGLRRSVRLSFVRIDAKTPPISKRGRPKKQETARTVDSNAHLTHEEKILKLLSTGSLKELVTLPTVGPKTAALIITHRNLHGAIDNIGEIENIRGFSKNQAKKFLWANSLV